MIGKLLSINESTASSISIKKPFFKVGRNQNSDLYIPDIKVSVTHLEIKYSNHAFSVTDHSSNGTYLNDNKIGKGNTVILEDGDIIHILHPSKVKENEVIGFKFNIVKKDQLRSQTFRQEELPLKKKVNLQQENNIPKQKGTEESQKQSDDFMRNYSYLKENIYKNDEFKPLVFEQHEYLGAHMQTYQNMQKQCKSCAGKEWKNYSCSNTQIHVFCASCSRMMPKRILTDEENDELKMHCFICKAYHCQYYYGDCTRNKFMLVKQLEKSMIIPKNYINPTEYDRLLKHLNGRPEVTIFNFMMENYIIKGYFYFQENKHTSSNPLQEINSKITPETPICQECISKLINFIIFKYVQCLKYDEPLFMNEDCHYGINCRLQQRDVHHAKSYNHFCEQTQLD